MTIPEEYPAQRSSKIRSELEKVLLEFHRRCIRPRGIYLTLKFCALKPLSVPWQDGGQLYLPLGKNFFLAAQHTGICKNLSCRPLEKIYRN